MKMKKTDRLMQDWLHETAELSCKYGKIDGTILYGNRQPIRSSIANLTECEIGSKRNYWFVTPSQDTKVRLYFPRGNGKELRALGRDIKIFRVKIIKKGKK